jgi:hypothetical protein
VFAHCAPNGSTCFSSVYDSGEPILEVEDVRFGSGPDKLYLTWGKGPAVAPGACPVSGYLIATGSLSTLPVGSAPGGESCDEYTSYPYFAVPAVPDAGTGFWYLVRGYTNIPASFPITRYGPLGSATAGPRTTAACP